VAHTALCWRQAGQAASFPQAVASAQHALFMHVSQDVTPAESPHGVGPPLDDDDALLELELGHPALVLLEVAPPEPLPVLLEVAPPEPLPVLLEVAPLELLEMVEMAPPEPLLLDVAPLDEEALLELAPPAPEVPEIVATTVLPQPAATMKKTA
jgi:hypothetical protein